MPNKSKSYQKLIKYTVVVLKDGRMKFLDLTGKAFKISQKGLCFFTKYPLELGHVLEFRSHALRSHGIVMWVKDLGDVYLASVRLVSQAPPPGRRAGGFSK